MSVPEPLQSSVAKHTHEGTVLRIVPVFDPIHPLLWALGAATLWAPVLGVVAIATAIALDASQSVGSLLAGVACSGGTMLGAIASAMAAYSVTDRRYAGTLTVEVGATRLRIREAGIGRIPFDVLLADLVDVEVVDETLVLRLRDGEERVRIPDRSERTRQALAELIATVKARMGDRGGAAEDVPDALKRLALRQPEG